MKKRVLIALAVGVAMVAVGALTVSAMVQTTPIPSFGVGCSQPLSQLCNPPYFMPVTTGGELQVEYLVPGHCSSIKLHLLVDGTVVQTTGWLGWPGAPPPFDTLPLTTGLVNLGPVSPGTHILGLQAEGQNGGCNGGLLGSWGGTGLLVTSTHVPVSIDIKPGSDPNCINLGSKGVVPVAILSSDIFDATQVDPDTVELAGAEVAVRGKGSKLLAHEEDVNEDGLLDLVIQVDTENFDPDGFQDGFATLTGNLYPAYGGWPIEGTDSICIVPPE